MSQSASDSPPTAFPASARGLHCHGHHSESSIFAPTQAGSLARDKAKQFMRRRGERITVSDSGGMV
eukprot:2708491-Rhodomonas_salina.2